MAAKKFLIVKLLIAMAAAGGLAWWIAVGPAVNIDRTYDGVLWRSHDASLCAPVTVHVTGTMDRRTFSGDIVVEGADLEMTGVRAHMKNGHAFLDKVPHDYIDQPYLAAVLQTGRFSSFVLFVGEPDSVTETGTQSSFGGADALVISAPCTDRAGALAVFDQLRETNGGLPAYITDTEWA